MSLVELRVRFYLFLVWLFLSVFYTYETRNFRRLATYAPRVAGVLAIVFFSSLVIREARRIHRTKAMASEDTESDDVAYGRTMESMGQRTFDLVTLRRGLRYLGSFILLAALIWLFGLVIAAPAFILWFMGRDEETPMRLALVFAASVLVFLFIFAKVGLVWPSGVLVNVTF